MASQDKGQQPATIKESLILNIRRNQAIIQDNMTKMSQKILVCDEVIKLLEADDEGTISKFIELSNILQGGAEQAGQ